MAFENSGDQLESTVQTVSEAFDTATKSLERSVRSAVLSGGDAGQVQSLFVGFKNSIPENFRGLTEYGSSLSAEFEEGVVPEDLTTLSRLSDAANLTVAAETDSAMNTVLALIIAGAVISETDLITSEKTAGKISGVFLDSQDPSVIAAQNRLAKLYSSGEASQSEIRTAIDVIRKQVSGVDLSNSLRTTLRGAVSDAVYDFHGAFVLAKASRLGYSKYQYRGGVVRNSRDFCINHVNQTYTEGEIRRIWRGSWTGKRPGDPFVVRGGYNCRHYWVPKK